MIVTNITNQSIAIFFTIFPKFNKGFHHSLYIIIICLSCSVVSVILWIFGEKNEDISNALILKKCDTNIDNNLETIDIKI